MDDVDVGISKFQWSFYYGSGWERNLCSMFRLRNVDNSKYQVQMIWDKIYQIKKGSRRIFVRPFIQRLNGLGVWFLLRVQEVPGSNPGWAHNILKKSPKKLENELKLFEYSSLTIVKVSKVFICNSEQQNFINHSQFRITIIFLKIKWQRIWNLELKQLNEMLIV